MQSTEGRRLRMTNVQNLKKENAELKAAVDFFKREWIKAVKQRDYLLNIIAPETKKKVAKRNKSEESA